MARGRGHCRRSGSSSSGKSTCYCHLLLVAGVVIVVAAVSDFQAISGCSISWCRSSSCVEIADSIIATTALVVVMSRCLISTELLVALLLLVVVLLHFVLRLGAIVVIVVVLHIRLRLHGGIVLNGGSRFGLAADLLLTTATTQMLDLRVVDELRFRWPVAGWNHRLLPGIVCVRAREHPSQSCSRWRIAGMRPVPKCCRRTANWEIY